MTPAEIHDDLKALLGEVLCKQPRIFTFIGHATDSIMAGSETSDYRRYDAGPDVRRIVDGYVWSKLPETGKTSEPKAKRSREKMSAVILGIMDESADLVPWNDGKGGAYASFKIKGIRQDEPIRSGKFRSLVSSIAWSVLREPVSRDQMSEILDILVARALHEGPVFTPSMRVAGNDQELFLDLGREVVRVNADGYEILDYAPDMIHFIRPRNAGLISRPSTQSTQSTQKNGCLRGMLEELKNYDNPEDSVLDAAWLLAALRPPSMGSYPIKSYVGEQGSAKSTAAAADKKLIDPATPLLRSFPRNIDDLFVSAYAGHVLAYDNLSHLSADSSDLLCMLSTGGGFGKREQYSDLDEIVVDAKRAIITTSIADIVERGDLADRALVIPLRSIPSESRMTERKFWKRFDALAPEILNSLLLALSAAIREKALQNEDDLDLPRMADFYAWSVAAENGGAWTVGDFRRKYILAKGKQEETVLEGLAIASAFRRAVANNLPWRGTATDLFREIEQHADDATRRSRSWPQSARGLSSMLRRYAPAIRSSWDIDIVFDNSGKERIIYIHTADKQDFASTALKSCATCVGRLSGFCTSSDRSEVCDDWTEAPV